MPDALVGDATKRRLFAAGVDNLLAMFAALLAASRLPQLPDGVTMSVAVGTYLAYFLVQEALWSNTLGKRLFGLEVRRLDGARCGWTAAAIRTAMRVLEVNPVLLGALPAAIAGSVSKRHQRFGDMLSGCLVVRAGAHEPEHEAVEQGDEADEP